MIEPFHNMADGVPGDSSRSDDVVEFRVPRSHFYVGLVSLVAFLGFGTASVVIALTGPDGFPHPIRAALFFGVFWGAWSLLSLWMFSVAWKDRLFLDDRSLRFEGLFGSRVLFFEEITEARWRTSNAGGSVLFRTPSRKLAIHFRSWQNGNALYRCLRAAIDPEVQFGWDAFREWHEPSPEQKQAREKKQRRVVLILSSVLLAYGVFFAVVQQFLPRPNPGLYLLVALNLGVGIYFLARRARRKQPTTVADNFSKKD